MLQEEFSAKRTASRHQARQWIGAPEAQTILGVCRATVLKHAQSGRLQAKFIERPGVRRAWKFRLSSVLCMKREGTARKYRPPVRRIRVAWVRAFGPVPRGMTVIARDGNCANSALANLALAPVSARVKYQSRPRRKAGYTPWTKEMYAILRRDYPTRTTSDLASQLGVSVVAIRSKAGQLRLRKSLAHLRAQWASKLRLPLGTEIPNKGKGTIRVKVAMEGPRNQQWRPKHHLIWEEAHCQKVPAGHCVAFRDGDRGNFSPDNLVLTTRREASARGLANFLKYPAELREAIKMTRKIERAVASRERGDHSGEFRRRRRGLAAEGR